MYKIMKFRIEGLLSLFLLLGMAVSFVGCTEDIDESNYKTKVKDTLIDMIEKDPELSDIKEIFDRVRLGNSGNASSISAVLSARGNYTVFAPTNAAVRAYVDSLVGGQDLNNLSYEQLQLIAYNCIIDNGTDAAYETPDFPERGAFSQPNLSDRQLTSSQEVAEGSQLQVYMINGTSKLITTEVNNKEDGDATNGVLHVVDKVISLSTDPVSDMIINADNMKIMGTLIQQTGWADSLQIDRDIDYENTEHPETMSKTLLAVYFDFVVPQKRYLGFTAFIEKDDVFQRDWGVPSVELDAAGNVTNWDAIYTVMRDKVEAVYGTTDRDNLTSPENAFNRFVAYHLVAGKMPFNKLVTHFNEYGYKYGNMRNPQSVSYSVDVWDYYTTMGKYPDLLKITQVPDLTDVDHPLYLNRVSQYNDGFDGDYSEVSTIAFTPGVGLNIRIDDVNEGNDNNALNGFYYPIDGILIKTEEVTDALGSERIRFDLTSVLTEIQSNSMKNVNYYYFPKGYFSNISNESSGTLMMYLTPAVSDSYNNWTDYQGDEFLFGGLFDFVLKMPPVPKTGTYEIRAGISQNNMRGMAQLYIGTDPYHLSPIGLPLDLRQSVNPSPDKNPQLNWPDPASESGMDSEMRIENDKNLRNQGYMKAPLYFGKTDGTGTSQSRYLPNGYDSPCVRRIVGIQYMEANKSYYIRFKSALEKTDAQFFLDYFEYCPAIVYNGAKAENPW